MHEAFLIVNGFFLGIHWMVLGGMVKAGDGNRSKAIPISGIALHVIAIVVALVWF